jgi:assimilatory nitrate reductase catalytic subunit
MWWPERVAHTTGVPAPVLRRAARLLAEASPTRGGAGAVVLTGRGAEQHTDGTDTVTAAINLALALGLPGRPASGYGCLTGQGNGQGGREHGQKADQLPGYRMIDDPAARAHVAAVWGVDAAALPGAGVPAVELLGKLGGEVRALFVHGANPLVSAPDATAVRQRMQGLDLLVVCDFVPSETAQLADVVLPVTQWAEEEGTMTNLEGRVLRRRKALDAPGHARSELDVLAELARLLDAPGVWDSDPALVFDELARASTGGRADYSGLSHARLDEEPEGLFWPCATGSSGTPRMFTDRFAHADGRARLEPTTPGAPADDLVADRPVYLVTGRLLAHYQSGAQTRRVATLTKAAPEPYVELHPQDAASHNIRDADLVCVSTGLGAVLVRALISQRQTPGSIFVPMHWNDQFAAKARVDALVPSLTDPISGQPASKNIPARIGRFKAAAYGFAVMAKRPARIEAEYWALAKCASGWRAEFAFAETRKNWTSFFQSLFSGTSAEIIAYHDTQAGHFRFAAFSSDRLVAALFLAPEPVSVSRVWAVEQLSLRHAETRARFSVIAGRPGKGTEDQGATVCSCFGVGGKAIAAAVRRGCTTVEAIGKTLQAGTNCGSCRGEIRQIIEAQRVTAAE